MPFAVSSPNFSLAEQMEEPWTDCLSISGASRNSTSVVCQQVYAALYLVWRSAGFYEQITSANAEVRDQFDGSMPKSYYYPENFKRLDRAWELAEEKGLTVPQIALSYVLSFPLDIYALVGSANSDEIASNLQALQSRLTEEEMAWLDLRRETR